MHKQVYKDFKVFKDDLNDTREVEERLSDVPPACGASLDNILICINTVFLLIFMGK